MRSPDERRLREDRILRTCLEQVEFLWQQEKSKGIDTPVIILLDGAFPDDPERIGLKTGDAAKVIEDMEQASTVAADFIRKTTQDRGLITVVISMKEGPAVRTVPVPAD